MAASGVPLALSTRSKVIVGPPAALICSAARSEPFRNRSAYDAAPPVSGRIWPISTDTSDRSTSDQSYPEGSALALDPLLVASVATAADVAAAEVSAELPPSSSPQPAATNA